MEKGGVRHGRAAYRALALALAGLALALAGCGGGGDDEAVTPGNTITVREFDGETLTRTVPLDCAESGGACEAVIALLPRLAPDLEEVCTQIYGGPERRVVTGVVEGVAVAVEVTRADGCQIARYDLLTEALAG
jgi:hypothetical protein